MTSFLIAAICIVTALLAYHYLARKKQYRNLKSQIDALNAQVNADKAHAANLQKQLTTQKKQLKQAFEDPVTGLLGWQVFNDRIKQSINHAKRHQLSLGMLIVDVDDFNIINNAFGAEAGGEILHEFGQRIMTCLRQVDSACRLNQDTFAVLLTQVSKPESAVIVAQRILQALAEPLTVKSSQLHLTGCIGLSLYPQDANDAASLLSNADHALRNAKKRGKQTYQFYQESMHARSQHELLLFSGLSSETFLQELSVSYQPIVNVNDKSILCMDTQLEWMHPELGVIAEGELLHYADRQHKLNMITEHLLKQAVRQFVEWRKMGFKPTLLALPVRIKQLENSNFIYRLSLIMQETGFNPEQLLLQLNDHAELSSFDILEKSFNMLKYLNVKFAITNFNFGAVSLRYLNNITVSYIKLDNLLIGDITENERERQLVQSIIEFANSLAMQTIAQGVENEAQADLLESMGCHLIQGQLLGDTLLDDRIKQHEDMTTGQSE